MTERRVPLVYIDTNVFVDFLQGPADLVDRLESVFESLKRRPGSAAASQLCQYFLAADRRISPPPHLEAITPDETALTALEALLDA